MSISNLVLIHYNVEEPELLKSSFKNSHVIFYKNQSFEDINSEINSLNINITNLALVFHPTSRIEIPFFRNSNRTDYNIFRQGLVDLINLLNVNGNLIVDLLACEINDKLFM